MPKYFVWLSGMRGPEAQLWPEKPMNGNGKPTLTPLFEHELTSEESALSLDDLILKFKDKAK